MSELCWVVPILVNHGGTVDSVHNLYISKISCRGFSCIYDCCCDNVSRNVMLVIILLQVVYLTSTFVYIYIEVHSIKSLFI